MRGAILSFIAVLTTGACEVGDVLAPFDASNDAGFDDAGFDDAGFDDAGFDDAGFDDAGFDDAGFDDAGFGDAGVDDAGVGDAGFADAGLSDAGFNDAGLVDAGADTHPPCRCDEASRPYVCDGTEDYCDNQDDSFVNNANLAATWSHYEGDDFVIEARFLAPLLLTERGTSLGILLDDDGISDESFGPELPLYDDRNDPVEPYRVLDGDVLLVMASRQCRRTPPEAPRAVAGAGGSLQVELACDDVSFSEDGLFVRFRLRAELGFDRHPIAYALIHDFGGSANLLGPDTSSEIDGFIFMGPSFAPVFRWVSWCEAACPGNSGVTP